MPFKINACSKLPYFACRYHYGGNGLGVSPALLKHKRKLIILHRRFGNFQDFHEGRKGLEGLGWFSLCTAASLSHWKDSRLNWDFVVHTGSQEEAVQLPEPSHPPIQQGGFSTSLQCPVKTQPAGVGTQSRGRQDLSSGDFSLVPENSPSLAACPTHLPKTDLGVWGGD